MDFLVPNGFISLEDAVGRVGAYMYSKEWKGRAYKLFTAYTLLEHANRTVLALPPEAKEEREAAQRVVLQEFEKLDARNEQLHSAIDRLRMLLHARSVRSILLDPASGHQPHIPVQLWASSQADRIFKTGEAEFDSSLYPGSQPHGRDLPSGRIWGYVFVDGEKLTAALDGRPTQASSNRDTHNMTLDQPPPATPLIDGHPVTGKSTVGAETKCQAWLKEISSGNTPKPKSKPKLCEDAMEKFPGLSGKGFDRAWHVSVPDTWKSAGAPKKSSA